MTMGILFIVSNIISYVRSPKLTSKQLPMTEVQLLDNSNYKIKKDKPLVVHFWATWCPTCKLEAANIESISKNHEVITIAVGSGDNEKINAYMKNKGLSFKVINDNDGT